MKLIGLIGTGVLLLLLGAAVPTYALQDQHEQDAKPPKQGEKAKPAKQEQQAKPEKQQEARPAKQEKQAKPEKQQEAKAPKQEKQAKPEKQQEGKVQQGQWARNGQRDNRGHEFNESRFGREHHARFEENGGRFYSGRREYSYGGYWFYAGAYPAWFYQQDVYFIMGADGLWYAVAYGDPSLMFQVDID